MPPWAGRGESSCRRATRRAYPQKSVFAVFSRVFFVFEQNRKSGVDSFRANQYDRNHLIHAGEQSRGPKRPSDPFARGFSAATACGFRQAWPCSIAAVRKRRRIESDPINESTWMGPHGRRQKPVVSADREAIAQAWMRPARFEYMVLTHSIATNPSIDVRPPHRSLCCRRRQRQCPRLCRRSESFAGHARRCRDESSRPSCSATCNNTAVA